MAKTNQGILGAFTGTIGPVTGYIRDGQNILRTSRSNVNYKHTPSRIEQLEKIKICNSFTKAFSGTGFFNKAFPAYGSNGSGYNRATSALTSQALTGPDIQLSYQKVLISKGKLPGAENALAVAAENGTIYFSFTNNSDTGTASAFDKVIMVAYAEVLQQAVFSLNAGLRKNGEAVLQAGMFKEYTVETWIGF